MSTHIKINGLEPDTARPLSESCDFCDMPAGQPCEDSYQKRLGKRERYICPDEFCEQLYATPGEALHCVSHLAKEN